MQEYNVKVYNCRTDWYQNGKLHRIGGPAVENKNGERHRIDGPAIEYPDGDKEYWENGVEIPDPNVTREMTVAEIIKELGYNVKIVK